MSSEDGTEPQNLAQRARHTAQPSKGQLGTQEHFSDSCMCRFLHDSPCFSPTLVCFSLLHFETYHQALWGTRDLSVLTNKDQQYSCSPFFPSSPITVKGLETQRPSTARAVSPS